MILSYATQFVNNTARKKEASKLNVNERVLRTRNADEQTTFLYRKDPHHSPRSRTLDSRFDCSLPRSMIIKRRMGGWLVQERSDCVDKKRFYSFAERFTSQTRSLP